jgi:hypothetical protein
MHAGRPLMEMKEFHRAMIILSSATALIYLADRTGLWLKEQKQFNAWTFGFLNLAALVVGLGTMKRADKDLGFLNREQTDEWKGWMQSTPVAFHRHALDRTSL